MLSEDLDSIIARGLSHFENFEGISAPPESLPLLEGLEKAQAIEFDFSGCDVLFIQHMLGPTLARLNTMWKRGLERARTWFVDIPYSTHAPLRDLLVSRGIPRSQIAPPFDDPLTPYSTAQELRVAEMLRSMREKGLRQRVLVVDDGAYFLRVMHVLRAAVPDTFEAFAGRTSIVEQTTRGDRYLRQRRYQRTLRALGAPAVSIARCDAKCGFEGPFIGQAVAAEIRKQVTSPSRSLGRAALLGFGVVGRATLRRIMRDDHGPIDVVDPDVSTHAEIRQMGAVPHARLPSSGGFDTVIGCTGLASFSWDCRELLRDDASLVSGSSAAIEFNRELFIERAARDPDDHIEVVDPEATLDAGIHATIRFRDGDRHFAFLNAGFPVNFDGRLECLPPDVIQATHGLLLLGSMQALTAKPGMHELERKHDQGVFRTATELLLEIVGG